MEADWSPTARVLDSRSKLARASSLRVARLVSNVRASTRTALSVDIRSFRCGRWASTRDHRAALTLFVRAARAQETNGSHASTPPSSLVPSFNRVARLVSHCAHAASTARSVRLQFDVCARCASTRDRRATLTRPINRERDMERRPLPFGALHRDRAAMRIHHVFHDLRAESRAPNLAADRLVGEETITDFR